MRLAVHSSILSSKMLQDIEKRHPLFPRYTIHLLHQFNAALCSPFPCSTWPITDVYASVSLLWPEHLLKDYRVKHWL